MLKAFLEWLQEVGNLKSFFYLGQAGVGVVFVFLIWFFRPRSPESNFRAREADLRKNNPTRSYHPGRLAEARIQRQEPLRIEGIRLDGKPHEILGVARDATSAQVQQAYRDLMKRYHPDRVGRPGTREWTDAQKIAEAINRAKDAMLKASKLS